MSEWISVNDRLPDTDDIVLAVFDGKVEIAKYCEWRKRDDELNGRWVIVTDYEYNSDIVYDAYYPTHWMPLPAPPETP